MATYEGPPIWQPVLALWQERVPGLVVGNESNGMVWIGSCVEPEAVQLVFLSDHSDSEHTIYCDHWHGHYEKAGEAVETAINLLVGARWITEEFRGDEPSATWMGGLEPGGTTFSTEFSFLLNPLDSGDWELFPGESWKSISTIRHYFDLGETPATGAPIGEKSTWTNERTEPSIRRTGKDFNWMDQWFGPPEPGMRWTMAGFNQYCFQAPVGWRRAKVLNDREDLTTFRPKEGHPTLHVSVAFRDATSQATKPEPYGVTSYQRDYEFQERDNDSNYSLHLWTSIFLNGDTEMLARIFLYVPRSRTDEHEKVVELFNNTVKFSRYASGKQ